jgi:hypothetical protein
MAYRELGMVEIREVLRRWLAGDGLRAIARGTGIDRKTTAKYTLEDVARVRLATNRKATPPSPPEATSPELTSPPPSLTR